MLLGENLMSLLLVVLLLVREKFFQPLGVVEHVLLLFGRVVLHLVVGIHHFVVFSSFVSDEQ